MDTARKEGSLAWQLHKFSQIISTDLKLLSFQHAVWHVRAPRSLDVHQALPEHRAGLTRVPTRWEEEVVALYLTDVLECSKCLQR